VGQVRKIKAGLVKISVNDFVGEDGNVFFDTDDGVMRLSDGTTPGGVPLSSGSAEGGASTFRQLLDTPSSFSGAASRFVKVNPQASALEFVDVDIFDGDYNNLSNLPILFNPSSITTSLIPQTDVAIDLGSITRKWRELHLSGSSIYLGDTVIKNIDGTIELPANAKINGQKIPLDVSELTDTSNLLGIGGVTSYNDLTDRPTLFSGSYIDLTNTPTIPTDLSELTDNTNLLAGAGGDGSYTLPIATNNALGGIKIGTGLSINGSGVVSVTAVGVTSYNDLTDTPTIPADVSELTDTTNLLGHFSGAYADLTGLPVLVTSYNDLTDTPTLFSGAYADLTDTPTLFSGAYADLTGLPVLVTSYNDLTDTPTLFSGAYADLTGLPALFDGVYSSLSGLPTLFSGSYLDLTNTPAIPADISELTDASGLLSAATFDGSYSSLTGTPDLSVYQLAVTAFSGSYTDLTNKPILVTSYNDLTDLPTLFDGAYSSLTGIPTTLAGYGVEVEVSTAISTAVNNVLDGAPALLDTLNEIAAAVGDDPNFVTTINTAVALKANTSDLSVVATSNNYEDLTNLPVIPADVAELSDALKSIVPNAEAEIFAMAVMLG
jgi:hypothetical protein